MDVLRYSVKRYGSFRVFHSTSQHHHYKVKHKKLLWIFENKYFTCGKKRPIIHKDKFERQGMVET